MIKTVEVGANYCSNPLGQTGTTGAYCNKYINVDTGYNYGGEISFEQGFFADDMLILGADYSYI